MFLQNSLHIYEQSRGRTKQYLIDITYQLHEHIETQIQNSLEMLRLIRNGALEIEPEERERYLTDLADFSNFNSLHLVSDFDQAEAWLRQHYGGQYVLDRDLLQQGQAQLIAIPGKSMVVYFTADHADQDTSVIIGEKGNELLKELLSNNSFDGQARQEGGKFLSSKRAGAPGVGLSSIRAVAKTHQGDARFEAQGTTFLSSVYVKL